MRSAMVLGFGVMAAAVVGLAHYYLWRRLVRDTALGTTWRRVATALVCALGASIPLTFWSARLIDARVGQILGWPVFIWLALGGLAVLALLAVDLSRLAASGARRASAWWRARSDRADDDAGDDAAPINPGRRALFARLAGGVAMTAASGTTAWGMRKALSDVEIAQVPIELDRLPRALDGFAIAQITDIHVGYTVGRSYVRDVVDRTNALGADLIAITGDLVDGPVAALAPEIAPLADLRAPHGVYFVTGNHEYYSGVEAWLAELREMGIRVLRNERVTIGEGADSFELAGVDDYNADRFGNGHGPDMTRALAGRDPDREVVLLAHQPRHVHEAARHDVGLQLSGHTHGGQMWPWHYLAKAQQGGLLAGRSRHGRTQLYISRGTGYWGPPVRVCAPPEITRVVLRAPVGSPDTDSRSAHQRLQLNNSLEIDELETDLNLHSRPGMSARRT